MQRRSLSEEALWGIEHGSSVEGSSMRVHHDHCRLGQRLAAVSTNTVQPHPCSGISPRERRASVIGSPPHPPLPQALQRMWRGRLAP